MVDPSIVTLVYQRVPGIQNEWPQWPVQKQCIYSTPTAGTKNQLQPCGVDLNDFFTKEGINRTTCFGCGVFKWLRGDSGLPGSWIHVPAQNLGSESFPVHHLSLAVDFLLAIHKAEIKHEPSKFRISQALDLCRKLMQVGHPLSSALSS